MASPRGREQREHLRHRGRGQFLEQRRAIVRRHVVEDVRGGLVAHRLQHRLLGVRLQVLEDLRRLSVRQQAEDDGLLLLREIPVMHSATSAGDQSAKTSRSAAKLRASISSLISGPMRLPSMWAEETAASRAIAEWSIACAGRLFHTQNGELAFGNPPDALAFRA